MSSSDSANEPKPLTARELEILKHAWNCMSSLPEIDYHKLAAACGMTNPRSASNAWAAIKKKLFADVPAAAPTVDDDGNPVTPAKRKRATPAKKKAAPAPAADGDDEDDELQAETEEKLVVQTPAKKKRTPAKKKATPASTDAEADAEDSTTPATPAKKKRATPAKKRAPKAKKEEEEKAAAAEEDAAEAAKDVPAPEPKFELKDQAPEDVAMENGEDKGEI